MLLSAPSEFSKIICMNIWAGEYLRKQHNQFVIILQPLFDLFLGMPRKINYTECVIFLVFYGKGAKTVGVYPRN